MREYYLDPAAHNLRVISLFLRLFRVFKVAKFDEAKASGTAGIIVSREIDITDLAELGVELLNLLCLDVEVLCRAYQIADE